VKQIPRYARDFACGLTLGVASLTPAKQIPRYARDFACGLTLGVASLTPAKRLNFTNLFAFFLPKGTVFLTSLSATISQVKNVGPGA
jgi:hypothetical protein